MWDGRRSIEHQLEIHVDDLLQCAPYGGEVYEILCGLQYVLNYRIRGDGKLTSLSGEICNRLVRALLLAAGAPLRQSRLQRALHGSKFTREADLAFALLVDFVMRVPECYASLLGLPLDEVAARLQLARRVLRPPTPAIEAAARDLLISIDRGGQDWKLFVDPREIGAVEEALSKQEMPLGSPTVPTTCPIHPPPALYFDRDPDRVLDMFQISLARGLSGVRAQSGHLHYGPNELPKCRRRSLLSILGGQVADFMIFILAVTMVVSIIIDWPRIESALTLGLVILLNVGVGMWQEYSSAQAVAAMQDLQVPTALVRRDGAESRISAAELVPGDLVLLSEGDFVPADLRLLYCAHLEAQESILTGESASVAKTPEAIRIPKRKLQIAKCRGNVFMGTMISRGTAVGAVVRTGVSTEIGQIGHALLAGDGRPSHSPLQRKLAVLSRYLVFGSLLLCALVLGIGLVQKRSVVEMLRLSVSLAVSVIPEGLLAILTVSMALAIRRLARQHVLVRQLNAVEKLGAVSLIASDKTGTLTEGKMKLEAFWDPSGSHQPSPMALKTLLLCNNVASNGQGSCTEVALLKGAKSLMQPPGTAETIEQSHRRLLEIPFDSDRKMMSVLVEAPPPTGGHQETGGGGEEDRDQDGYGQYPASGQRQLLTKGAPEVLLGRCRYVERDGRPMPLEKDDLEAILAAGEKMSDGGLRLLALACRETVSQMDAEELEEDLCFLGLVGLMDPPRAGVAKSIADCQAAGIRVLMITGDGEHTARAIGQKLGIYDATVPELARVARGQDVDLLGVQELASLQPFPSVFARVSPRNKLSIVQALQLRGEQVAMTGDGVNDAPAIRHADIGIAMGMAGTSITRDAASVILQRDDFAVIVRSIAQGRQMYHNVARFLIYLLSCNSAEIWTVLGALILGWESPMSPLGILWANLIADIPPSLCLGLERDSEATLMRDRPRSVPSVIMGAATWVLIAVNGLVLSALTLFSFAPGLGQRSLPARRSEAFLHLIGMQLVLALFSRSSRASCFQVGLLGNRWLLLAVIVSFGLLLAGLYIPPLHRVLQLEPVPLLVWGRFVGFVLILAVANETTKLLIRRMQQRCKTKGPPDDRPRRLVDRGCCRC